MRILISLILLCVIATPLSAMDPQGWLWYTPVPKKLTRTDETKVKRDEVSRDLVSRDKVSIDLILRDEVSSAEDRIKRLQKIFSEAKAKAVLQPTFNNVLRVQRLQRAMLQQATEFEKMWRLTSLIEVDNYPGDNPNVQHRKIQKSEEGKHLVLQLRSLSKQYGLFFLFKQGCPYCHQFAPIVKQFANTYGFAVKAVSADGGSLAEFPEVAVDNGAIAKLNPQGIFPALLLANPTSGQVLPLSWGMTSLSGLQQNAKTVVSFMETQNG